MTSTGGPGLAVEPGFVLGGLIVRPSTREVIGDGETVLLEPRVMQVLVALARKRGHVVSRFELIEECWGGRTVGDDAINRCIQAIRRIGEERGGFSIRTVARVGYRLDEAESPIAAAKLQLNAEAEARSALPPLALAPLALAPLALAPLALAPLALGGGFATPQTGDASAHRPAAPMPLRSQRRAPFIVAALATAALTAALLAFWLTRPAAKAAHYTLRVAQLQAIDAGVPDHLAAMLQTQIGAAFATDKVIAPVASAADFVLGGTIARADDRLHFALTLTDRSGDNVQAWTQDTSADSLRSATQVSMKTAQLIRCGLVAFAEYPRLLPRHLRNLYVELCTGGVAGRRLDIAQTLTREAPDFAGGWAQLGYAYGSAAFAGAARDAPLLRARSRAAAERALAIDPQSSSGYRVLAWAQAPATPYHLIEALLQKATSRPNTSCSCEHRDFGDFLLDVGRTKDAIGEYQRAVDIEPGGSEDLSLAHSWYFDGRPARAQEVLDTVERMWGDKDWIAFARLDSALSRRDWAKAGRLIARYADTDNERAIAAGFAAVGAGDAARLSALVPLFERLAQTPTLDTWKIRPPMLDERPALLLMLAGRGPAAIEAIAKLIERYGPDGGQLLFNPVARSLRQAPGYLALLERSGLMNYWRRSHTIPDICSEIDSPAFCAQFR